MTGWFAGPVAAAALLMVAAGIPKIVDPYPLVRAVSSIGLPAHRSLPRLVRVGALLEALVGAWALIAPHRAPVTLVALSYAGFTAFVLAALRSSTGVLSSCGCFGKADTPPTRSHAVVTGILAVSATAAAVTGPASWPQLVATTGTAGLIALLASTLLLAFLVWQALAVLAQVSPVAVRSVSRTVADRRAAA